MFHPAVKEPAASEHVTRQTLLFGHVSPLTYRNAKTVVCGDFVWGFQASLWAGATVLTVLLQKLGVAKGTIGVIGALEGGGLILPQMIGAYVFHFRRNRKVRLIVWHTILVEPPIILMAPLLYFSPRLPVALVVAGLFIGFAMVNCGLGLITPTWINWIADLFEPGVRGRVVGLCMAASSLAGVFGTLLAGELIRNDPRPEGFALNYLLAGILAAVSLAIFFTTRDEHVDAAAAAAPPRSEMARHFLQSLRDANFQAFVTGRILAALGFSILPFVAVHYMSPAGGGLTGSTVVHAATAMAAMLAVSYYATGRLGDARGHKLGIIICCVMQAVALLIMLTTHGLLSCVLAYAAAGLAIGAGNISQFNLILETCPHDSRAAHLTAGSAVHSAVAIGAPLASGVAAQLWGTWALFMICLPLSLAAVAWFAFRMREPREAGGAMAVR